MSKFLKRQWKLCLKANANRLLILVSESLSCGLTQVSPVTGDISRVDVFREFSLLASLQPEKLRRRSIQFSQGRSLSLTNTSSGSSTVPLEFQ